MPVLVVQGACDRFGTPAPTRARSVAVVSGDHGLKAGVAAVHGAVAGWLSRLMARR